MQRECLLLKKYFVKELRIWIDICLGDTEQTFIKDSDLYSDIKKWLQEISNFYS